MAIPIKKYGLRKSRLAEGIETGFTAGEDGVYLTAGEQVHVLRPERLDSAMEACAWGRLVIDGNLPADSVMTVCVYASDEERLVPEQCTRTVDARDLLLYEQRGRYLWLWLEIVGAGEGVIQEIQVYTPGDIFLNTFPEIYREHGSFFHRYLSIFSSLYLDFQQKIDALHTRIDLELAPPSVLPVLVDWLGIEVEDSLLGSEDLRNLLREAPYLIRYKGTKGAIERLSGLLLDAEVIVVERGKEHDSDRRFREAANRLYGTGAFDITILAMREYDESLKNRLLCLLDQFKPVRSQVNLVFMRRNSILGGYCYLDINATLHESAAGMLDGGCALDDGDFMKQEKDRKLEREE